MKMERFMKDYDFNEAANFEGLMPKINSKLPVIGNELEVADIQAIADGE